MTLEMAQSRMRVAETRPAVGIQLATLGTSTYAQAAYCPLFTDWSARHWKQMAKPSGSCK